MKLTKHIVLLFSLILVSLGSYANTTLNLRVKKAPEYYSMSTIEIVTYDDFGYTVLYELPFKDTTYTLDFDIEETLVYTVFFPPRWKEKVILHPNKEVNMTIHAYDTGCCDYSRYERTVNFNKGSVNELRVFLDTVDVYHRGNVYGKNDWWGWGYGERVISKKEQKQKIEDSKQALYNCLDSLSIVFKDDIIAQQLITQKKYRVKLKHDVDRKGNKEELQREFYEKLNTFNEAFLMEELKSIVDNHLYGCQFYDKGIARVITDKSVLESYFSIALTNNSRLDSIAYLYKVYTISNLWYYWNQTELKAYVTPYLSSKDTLIKNLAEYTLREIKSNEYMPFDREKLGTQPTLVSGDSFNLLNYNDKYVFMFSIDPTNKKWVKTMQELANDYKDSVIFMNSVSSNYADSISLPDYYLNNKPANWVDLSVKPFWKSNSVKNFYLYNYINFQIPYDDKLHRDISWGFILSPGGTVYHPQCDLLFGLNPREIFEIIFSR